MENELRKLIDTYEHLIHDNKIPIDMTEYQSNHLEGYNAAIIIFVSQLKDILYRSHIEPSSQDKLRYTD